MAVGDWDITEPSGNRLVSEVDNQICEDKETLLNALGAEHKFEASDTSCNHLEGSARCWVDVAADRDLRDSSRGRLFVETDTHKLYYGDTEDAWDWFCPKRNAAMESFIPTFEVSTNSSSWVEVSYTNGGPYYPLRKVFTIQWSGSQLFIRATLTVESTVAAKNVYLTLAIDGVRITTSDNGLAMVTNAQGKSTISMNRLVSHNDPVGIDLTAGEHTVAVYWKVDSTGGAELVEDITQTLVVEEC